MTAPDVHPDTPKPAVHYRLANPDPQLALTMPRRCARCTMWRADSVIALVGVCTEVIGPIYAGGDCDDFDPKE